MEWFTASDVEVAVQWCPFWYQTVLRCRKKTTTHGAQEGQLICVFNLQLPISHSKTTFENTAPKVSNPPSTSNTPTKPHHHITKSALPGSTASRRSPQKLQLRPPKPHCGLWPASPGNCLFLPTQWPSLWANRHTSIMAESSHVPQGQQQQAAFVGAAVDFLSS